MKIILEYCGDSEDFKKAMEAKDDQFDLFDSIYYQMDYEKMGDIGIHRTEYGDINIIIGE